MTGSVDHFYYQTCDWCKSADLRVDIRAGDVICTNCGSVQQSRILDANDEMIIHEEERSSKLGRAAGLVSAYGGTDTLFLNGEESLCRSLERAQKAALSSTERMISKYIYLLSDVCTALDLPPSVKLSIMISCPSLLHTV